MNTIEIRSYLQEFADLTAYLQDMYEENGGEVTTDTEDLEERLGHLQLLLDEATDDLGRWLRSKEEEAKAAKAEKDYAARRQKAAEGSVEFIKSLIREVFDKTGHTEARGSLGYKFTSYDSVTTSVDKTLLELHYGSIAEHALRLAGIPDYITCKLSASVSAIPKDEPLPDVFQVHHKPTVKFTKPRSNSED